MDKTKSGSHPSQGTASCFSSEKELLPHQDNHVGPSLYRVDKRLGGDIAKTANPS